MTPKSNNKNQILDSAFGILEAVSPGFSSDPDNAFRNLVKELRFIVVGSVQSPTMSQLKALQAFDSSLSLVQVSIKIKSSNIEFGPFPGLLAEQIHVAALIRNGFDVSLRELTDAEKMKHLECLDNSNPYFSKIDDSNSKA